MKIVALLAILPIALGAADQKPKAAAASSIRASVIGFVATSSGKEMRLVSGIIGASGVDQPVPLGEDVQRVIVSPSQNMAIIQRGEDRTIEWLPLSNGAIQESRSATGVLSTANLVQFSPSGSYVALYSANSKHVQIVAVSSGQFRVVDDFDTNSFPSDVAAIAVSDAGALLMAVSNGETSFIASPSADGSYRILFNGGAVSVLRFFPRSNKVVLADRAANTIFLLDQDGEAPIVTTLASEADGVHDPQDIEISATRPRIFVANAGRNSVLMVDLAERRVQELDCPCTPSELRRVATSVTAVFDRNSDSIWLLDMSLSVPWLAYSPANP